MIPSTLCCIARATSSGDATPLSHNSRLVCERIHGIAVCHSIVASAKNQSHAIKETVRLTYHIRAHRLQRSNSAIGVLQVAQICSYARSASVPVRVHPPTERSLCIQQLYSCQFQGRETSLIINWPSARFIVFAHATLSLIIDMCIKYGLPLLWAITSSRFCVANTDRPMQMFAFAAAREVASSPSG
jgi:hypothetical protein